MQPFVYNALPSRVIFGQGTLACLADEVRALGCARALVLTTAPQRERGLHLCHLLGDLAVGMFNNATMHTPVEVTAQALQVVVQQRADCLIAIGGGSTIGLSKALALRTDLPQIVIPTTYAGSEATPIIGQTEGGLKTTQRTLKVLPQVVIYDVDLTLSLPADITATSGLNAIAHAVEALYAKDANPLISLLAQQGIGAISRALPVLRRDPHDIQARTDALFGAWLCGTCLGAVGMSIHHKLCHTLGGSFNLAHAPTHAVILPHAVAYNSAAAPAAMAQIAHALGAEDAAAGLFELARQAGAPTSLAELGMRAGDLDKATALACASPYWNPRPIAAEGIHALLEKALAGSPP